MQRPSLVLSGVGRHSPVHALFSSVRKTRPEVPVLILAATAEMADYEVFARFGASGVVLKPFVDDSLEVAIAKHLLVHKEEAGEPKEILLEGGHSFVRSSKRMREIEAQAQLVARSDIPVLILGESGTGKEIVAMYTHQMSRRSGRMFLKVNCAAMPADLLESELFGYEQGAFTGATKSKPGKFETCDGGTIFLDEIGEMPPGAAGQAAARPAGRNLLPPGKPRPDQDGRSHHCRHQRQYEGGDGPQDLPRGSSITASTVFRWCFRRCASGWTRFLPWRTISCARGPRSTTLQPLPISPALLEALCPVQLAREPPRT